MGSAGLSRHLVDTPEPFPAGTVFLGRPLTRPPSHWSSHLAAPVLLPSSYIPTARKRRKANSVYFADRERMENLSHLSGMLNRELQQSLRADV